MIIFLIQGCKKDFQPDHPNLHLHQKFYATDADVLTGTGALYSVSWSSYNGTPMNAFGDVLGGNLIWDNYQNRGAYINFSISAIDQSGSLSSTYNAFWSEIANANVIAYNIQTLPRRV